MNILVTGASGQLGKCIQDLAREHSDLNFSFTDIPELDITDENFVKRYFEDNSFDYCINCAAYTAVDLAESQVDKAYLINAEAVRILAEACKGCNCILIHISTDFVFDGTKNTPYNEEDEPNPINVYGTSKLMGERHVQEILEKYFIIRTSWVYSEYGHNFVKTMLRLGNEREEINVVCNQMGTPTYAPDLAKIIMKIIIEDFDEYGIYHFSNDGTVTWYDFAKAIFDESGIKIKVLPIKSEAYPTLAKRPAFSVMDKSKIKKALQMKMSYWRDSLKKYN